NDELVALTRELTDTLRRNKTIDWQKKESARARMRMLIKKLLKKYGYPPEGQEDALQTVMTQCELWTDHVMIGEKVTKFPINAAYELHSEKPMMVAEDSGRYNAD